MDQSPVIVLPTDESWQNELKGKLEEYSERWDAYLPPERQMGTVCKIEVLECLLRDGRVVTWDLSRELAERFGRGLDAHAFSNACGVIAEYCSEEGRGRLQRRR